MIWREIPETFLASAPVGEAFRAFACQKHPTLVELDGSGDDLVILSNGLDVAAVFRRARGRARIWQHFVEHLPSCATPDAAQTAAEMADWMFEHRGADSLWAFVGPGNDKARAFVEASGGRLVLEAGERDLYEFTRSVH